LRRGTSLRRRLWAITLVRLRGALLLLRSQWRSLHALLRLRLLCLGPDWRLCGLPFLTVRLLWSRLLNMLLLRRLWLCLLNPRLLLLRWGLRKRFLPRLPNRLLTALLRLPMFLRRRRWLNMLLRRSRLLGSRAFLLRGRMLLAAAFFLAIVFPFATLREN
jgi:hypothetical protein